ncbi:MAG: Gfo/Idh/MocA family oxidoreductase [Clostridia bacterium]|nr:Gfo/Idh/MocA family oxidoreductase [Clostridia bacterium]
MKCVLIGAGSRGMLYARWAYEHGVEITAVAEPRPERLQWAGEVLQIPPERLFSTAEELFAGEALGDTAIIASLDRTHFGHAMQAMDRGYDILLEKPISPSAWECVEVERRALELGRKVTVCHVLRYHALIAAIRAILDSGELGRVVNIKHTENVGNWHMAHSFVRGNWHSSAETAPIILAKACHDIDLLLWFTQAHCKRIAAFGSLEYFRAENAPEGSAERCCDCPIAEKCRFEAKKVYLPTLGTWPSDMVCLEQTEEALVEALRTSPYGRCVFRCDNDVCDHMSVAMEFDTGATATFTLNGHSDRMYRQFHIMCTEGEIEADDRTNTLTVRRFPVNGAAPEQVEVRHIETSSIGHGGSDLVMMEDFFLRGGAERSSVTRSVESHLMALAAEESRVTGRVVSLEEFRQSIQR